MRKHWFKLVLLSLALVCGVAVWGILDSLWNSMADFEAKSEIGAISEYFRLFAAGDYETAARVGDFPFDEKNSKEDYIQYLKDTFGSDFSDLRFAERQSDIPEEKLYRVYSGDTALGSVRLIPVEGQARDWKVVAQVEYAKPLTVTAPSFISVSANGIPLTEPGESSVHEDFAAVEQFITVPTKTTYTLEGYLYHPEITAVAPDGSACSQSVSEDGTVELFAYPSQEDQESFEALMTDFSKLYARFISEDASFASLKSKMLRGTTFYESVRTFYNGWYTTHTGYEFRDLSISDVVRTDESTFAGTIKFDYVVFRGKQEYVYPSSYRLSFCLSNGQWLLADLKIL